MNPTFWQSWLGISSLLIISVCSLYAISAPRGADTLHDRLFYWLMFFTSGAALFHIFDGSEPQAIMRTFIVVIAVRFVVSSIEKFLAIRKGAIPPRKDC